MATNASLLPDPSPDPREHVSARAEALVESYRRLAAVFHDVLSEQSPEALLDRIADTLAELVPYQDLHIYEADEKRRELLPVFARSAAWAEEILSNPDPLRPGDHGLGGRAPQPRARERGPPRPARRLRPGTPQDPEALITVPLIARGSLKGALNIYRTGEDASFDEDEFELARWFGDAAALALDNAQIRARLEHLAHTDSLTGLYNHRYFHERLRSELQRAGRAHDRVALMMLDIDDFKRVNDVCGHGEGDKVLQLLGEILRATSAARTRSAASAARSSRSSSRRAAPDDALGLAARLKEALLRSPAESVGETTLSIGIAFGPEHAMNARELVACAEAAMMTAKAQGKDRVVVFEEEGVAERPEAIRGPGRPLDRPPEDAPEPGRASSTG